MCSFLSRTNHAPGNQFRTDSDRSPDTTPCHEEQSWRQTTNWPGERNAGARVLTLSTLCTNWFMNDSTSCPRREDTNWSTSSLFQSRPRYATSVSSSCDNARTRVSDNPLRGKQRREDARVCRACRCGWTPPSGTGTGSHGGCPAGQWSPGRAAWPRRTRTAQIPGPRKGRHTSETGDGGRQGERTPESCLHKQGAVDAAILPEHLAGLEPNAHDSHGKLCRARVRGATVPETQAGLHAVPAVSCCPGSPGRPRPQCRTGRWRSPAGVRRARQCRPVEARRVGVGTRTGDSQSSSGTYNDGG